LNLYNKIKKIQAD